MDQITAHRLVCFQRLGRALLSLLSCPARPLRAAQAQPRDRVLSCGAEIMSGPRRGAAFASVGGGGVLRTDCRDSPEGS
jgi:hypothetical protein